MHPMWPNVVDVLGATPFTSLPRRRRSSSAGPRRSRKPPHDPRRSALNPPGSGVGSSGKAAGRSDYERPARGVNAGQESFARFGEISDDCGALRCLGDGPGWVRAGSARRGHALQEVGARMERNDDAGDALDDVARIHPAVDRLRQLLTSATILDLKASGRGYWADRRREAESRQAQQQTA